MPHDEHFLERLDRVTTSQVELALQLYRDPALLREIFYEARVDDGASRVALSLDDDVRGPFVIVTRAGVFVTCLGVGMSPRPHPIVTRGALDRAAARLGKVRGAIAMSERLETVDGIGHLWRRLYSAGTGFSREEFVQMQSMRPLLGKILFEAFVKCIQTYEETVDSVLRLPKLPRNLDATLRAIWSMHHALGHLALLIGLEGAQIAERLGDELPLLRSLITRPMMRTYMRSTMLKAAWIIARVGKPMLAPCKESILRSLESHEVREGAFGLLALGVRHARLRAEIQKAFSAMAHVDDPRFPPRASIGSIFGRCLDEAVAPAEGALALVRESGRAFWMKDCDTLFPEGSPFRFSAPEEVPDDLALPMCGWLNPSFKVQPNEFERLIAALTWASRARAEDFYLTAHALTAVDVKWSVGRTESILDTARFWRKVPAKMPAVSTSVGRNDACRCGSGKKAKRCCAA